MFYSKVLKDLIEVSGLREAESIVGSVTDDFYSKVKVIGT